MAKFFPIDGNHLTLRLLVDRLHPVEKVGFKCCNVQQTKHPPKGIKRGDTIWQFQKLSEPFDPRFAKILNIHPSLCPTDHRPDRYDNDVHQLMELLLADPRIDQQGKVYSDVS